MSARQPAIPRIAATMSFDDAADAVLGFLRERMPWGFWSIGRITDGQQVHLHLRDNTFDMQNGTAIPLEDTICVRMLAGEGPRIAPDVQSVPSYSGQAGAGPVGAYAGMPIQEADGSVFGVLCGLSRSPQDPSVAADEELLALLADMLGMVLASDRVREDLARRAAELERAADTDALTGLPNRRSWDRTLAEEDVRHAKFGDPAAVALLDLDRLKVINDTLGHAAGDDCIVTAARTLRDHLDDRHMVARLGGDEFAILLRDVGLDDARQLVDELSSALERAGAPGTIGVAPYTVSKGFRGALGEADQAMYAAKRVRRQADIPTP